jgi:putative membrane protein
MPAEYPAMLEKLMRRSMLVVQGELSMIANYRDHAANERTFLAWVRTGLAIAAFGFFLFKVNVFVVVGGASLPLLSGQAGPFVAVAARFAGLAMVVTGIAIIARSSTGFERTRRAIERDEVIQIPRTFAEPLLSTVLVVAVVIFCVYLVMH